jgi:WD40 repeat protein/S1-C subfamily serine protease
MSVPPRSWCRQIGLVVAMLLGLAAVAPGAGDQPEPPPTPAFDRIHQDVRQAAELRAGALASWRQGRHAEAIAAAQALIALRSRLGTDGAELGKYLQWKRQMGARRRAVPFGPQMEQFEMFHRYNERYEEDLLQLLSVHELSSYELLAAFSEARGDLAAAARAWRDLARLRSERLGSGHWLVDEARREADRLDRLAALPPARRRTIERAEGATAVLAVDAPDQGIGTAFCADPRGYFVTRAGVVNQGKRGRRTTQFEREKGTLVRLRTTIDDKESWAPLCVVLHAGRSDELVLPARVIRVRDDLDLALLKVRPERPLPELELGRRAPEKEAWACLLGYPLVPRGPGLLEIGQRPSDPRSIAVLRADPTRVGSFHRQQGRPWLIALDTSVSQVDSGGLSGGPVLDEDGRILGMMVEGLAGTDTHYVIPATRLAKFLDADRGRIDILFDPSPLDFTERKGPGTWTFDVARLDPLPAGAVVEVVLESTSAGRRAFAASPTGQGLFSARVIPVDPRDPDPVDVLAPGSTEPLRVADREVSAGGERLRLRDLRRIETRPSPHGYKADGRPFSGQVAGLGTLEGQRSQAAAAVDPAAAGSLTMFYPPINPDPVPFEIVVREGDKVLGRLRSTVPFRDPEIALCEPEAAESAGPRWTGATIGPATLAVGMARIVPAKDMPTDPAPNANPVLRSISCPGVHLYCASFAPDGRTCAFGGDDNKIRIVDAANGKEVRSLPQDSWVAGLSFSPDGRMILAGSHHKRVFSWDVAGGRAAHRLEDRTTPPLTRALLVPGGRRVLTQHEDETIRLWDVETGKVVRTVASPGRATLALSPDGRRLLLANAAASDPRGHVRTPGRTLRLLDLTADRPLWDLSLGDGPFAMALGFLPDGSLIAFHEDGSVVWRDADQGKERRCLKLAAWPRADVAAPTPDGMRAITGHDDYTARLWDLSDGRELSRVTLRATPSGIPAFSPDGRVAALGGWRGFGSLLRLPAPDPTPRGTRGVLPDAPLVRRLDGTIDALAVGGGGRYLLLKLKDRGRVAVFDANAADVVASLPLASDDALIAAGAEKVIVIYPSLGFVHRFDLTSRRLDATAAVTVPGRIDRICMGCDSAGPLLATWTPGNKTGELDPRWFSLIDPGTLKVIPIDSVRSDPRPMGPVQPRPGVFQVSNFNARRDVVTMRASAGGDLFALWGLSRGPSGVQTLGLRGRSIELTYQHDDAGTLAPGPDGRTILTGRGGIRDASGKALMGPKGPSSPEMLVPAISSPFFLGIRGLTPANVPNQARRVVATIHLAPAGEGPLAIIDFDEMQESGTGNSADARGDLTIDQRFLWLPAADLLITIPAARDRLFLRRLDLRGAIDRCGIDGPFPASPGLLTVPAGRPLRTRIRAVSRDERATFSLIRGPEGLTVSPDGTIAWEPPDRLAGQEVPAVLAVRGPSGRREEFTLTIRVR